MADRITELRQGGATTTAIAEWLNEEGVPPPVVATADGRPRTTCGRWRDGRLSNWCAGVCHRRTRSLGPTSPVVLGYIRAVDRWSDNPLRGAGL
ncbi:hypothetical protein [Geodermatophilus obscurus]|uniref:hypothetical protein n=1 Tax=Geodermatophilus obscurus TaxID=1861 RepID=UPI00019B73F1|nr:hypothetical protein [Geodermatophilus obscurus]